MPALARGDLDLVITSDPVDLPGVAYIPLFRYEAVLAIANNHRLADRRHVMPEDLAGEVLITYPVDRDRLDVLTRFLDPAGVAPERIRHAELTPMMVQLVSSGAGWRACRTGPWRSTRSVASSPPPASARTDSGRTHAAVRG